MNVIISNMKRIRRNFTEIILGIGLSFFLINFFTDQDAYLYAVSIPLIVIGLLMMYKRHFRSSSFVNYSEAFLQDDGEDDELYEEAKRIVIEEGKASTSFLQRKLRIGYSRAARLMDLLEEGKVIGPYDGSKPRKVI